MSLQFGQPFEERSLSHQSFREYSISHVFKKITQNVAPVVTGRVDMNHRVHLNVDETGCPEHLVRLSSHEQVDPVVPGVCIECFQQPIPSRRGWITEERSPVSLMAGNYASRPGQSDHFFHHALRLWHVYQDKAGVNHVKRCSWQAGYFGVSLQHLNIP